MENVKFDRIVSVNSEIEGHGARNLLDEEISPNKNWMCEKGTDKGVVILQLAKPTILASIHVGNARSAFVEILVGKAADADQRFESLLPMSILMKPHECKSGENKNQTRFFAKADFNEAAAAKPWDRIKVVCSQPFNRYVPYGLCFIKVQGLKEDKKLDLPTRKDEPEDIQIGSFFKKKRQSSGDAPLTVREQIKQADKESSLGAHTPSNISKIGSKLGDKLSSAKKIPEDDKGPKKAKVDKTPEKRKEERDSFKKEKDKEKTQKKQDEEKKPSKRKSPEKDDLLSKKRKEEKPKRRKKLFEKLMDDVVLVISGFKNPLRADIRSMALQMGAKYSADWESHCTHLVCAYENTPKFHQVKGKGKIVKKEWVEQCHKDRKRHPWRRFALDKSDLKKPESEEEVDAGKESEEEGLEKSQVAKTSQPGTSRDEERKESQKDTSSGNDYDVATDDDESDELEVDTTDYPMPYLPNVLSSKTFFIDPNVKTKRVLERYIIAYNGNVTETFNEDVEFYVTEKGGAPVELLRKKVPNLVAIKPSWIWEVKSKLECVPTTPHLVK